MATQSLVELSAELRVLRARGNFSINYLHEKTGISMSMISTLLNVENKREQMALLKTTMEQELGD